VEPAGFLNHAKGSYFIVQSAKLLNLERGLTHEVGNHVSRDCIITLTDAVLAMVMILLVLEIVVPCLSYSEAAVELPI
jgi:hypothetical protein